MKTKNSCMHDKNSFDRELWLRSGLLRRPHTTNRSHYSSKTLAEKTHFSRILNHFDGTLMLNVYVAR